MFSAFDKLNNINISSLDTENVPNIYKMNFETNIIINLNISTYDAINVPDINIIY